MTLTEFILQRIAEDEAVAQRLMDWDEAPRDRSIPWDNHAADGRAVGWGLTAVAAGLTSDVAAHIIRWDPTHVLAECAAKRAIIAFHRSWPVLVETPPEMEAVDGTDPSAFAYRMTQRIMWATEDEYRKRFGTEPPTAPMLRALAAVYADHPDYRQEWA